MDALSFLGGSFVTYCAVVGAWIVLRWGTTGVSLIWRKRRELDVSVKEDVEWTLYRSVEK